MFFKEPESNFRLSPILVSKEFGHSRRATYSPIDLPMRFHLRHLGRLFTTFALIVAFATTGFAHSKVQTTLTPELAMYVANGGSLADLCGTGGDADAPNLYKCEACRLTASAMLPDAAYGLPECVSGQTRIFLFVAKLLHNSHPLDPTRLTRAPPQA